MGCALAPVRKILATAVALSLPVCLFAPWACAAAESAKPEVFAAYTNLPLSFEGNAQTGNQVMFLAHAAGYTIVFGTEEIALFPEGRPATHSRDSSVRLRFVGSNPAVRIAGVDELRGRSNYLIGRDRSKWRRDLPNYRRVAYYGLYPGIDLIVYGTRNELEYDLVLAPGANPSIIRFNVDGVTNIRTKDGDLVLATSSGEVRLPAPVVFQEIGGTRRPLAGGYILHGGKPKPSIRNPQSVRVGFRVGRYDPSKPLVIDPVLTYASYFGRAGSGVSGITLDSAGNLYITGSTSAPDFPTVPAFEGSFGGGTDSFVMKINARGNEMLYSTRFGGIGDDFAARIAVDGRGNAFVTGSTNSGNFPVTAGAPQMSSAGGLCGSPPQVSSPCFDAFVLKLNPAGSDVVYGTYLGGTGDDAGSAIALDLTGNAYIAGRTSSADFPIVNALQKKFGGGGDAFFAKINTEGTVFLYASYLGGGKADTAGGVAVDSKGSLYLAGSTESADFPVANAFQAALKGPRDAFVAKVAPSGSSLVYATYIGGSGSDAATALAIDAAGNAYVTGQTVSADFPTVNAVQPSRAGVNACSSSFFGFDAIPCPDAFIAKLNASGSSLVYSTYLGGGATDGAMGIGIDAAGNAYVVGSTQSSDFPLVNPLQTVFIYSYSLCLPGPQFTVNCGAAFVTKLNAAGNALMYSTYLASGSLDSGTAIAIDTAGNAYVAGITASSAFPTLKALQERPATTVPPSYPFAPFFARIDDLAALAPSLPPDSITNAASFRLAAEAAVAPGSIVAIFGSSLAGAEQPGMIGAKANPPNAYGLPTSLFDTTVMFNGIRAPLFYVSPGQINAQVPFEVAPGNGTVEVKRVSGVARQTVPVYAFGPGIFWHSENGAQAGAILHGNDFRPVGQNSPAQRGEVVAIYCTGLGALATPVPTGVLSFNPIPTVVQPEVSIGGVPATVLYSGTTRALIGVYQVNVLVPANTPSGSSVPVRLTIGGVSSNTVTTAIQ